jgi:hypothetical protein
MALTKIYIAGNFLIAQDLINKDIYFKSNVNNVHHLRSLDDNFAFFQDGLLNNVNGEPQTLGLGVRQAWEWDTQELTQPSQTGFAFADIVDGLGVPYASANDFDDYLNVNLGISGTGGGLTQVAHDATLTGDGTVGSPLGVVGGGGGVFTPTINGTNMVEVSQESDFGVASLGIITLSPNTTYFIRGIVLCTNLLSIVNEGIALKGWNRDDDGLKYTGANSAGDFITIKDVNCDISNLKFSSTNSEPDDVVLRGSNFSYGAYNDGRLKVLTITNCQFRDCYDVLHLEGFDLADFSQTLVWYVKATSIGCQFKNVSKLQISSCEFVRWFDEATIPTPSGFATTQLVEFLANGLGNGFGAVNLTGSIFHPQETQFGIKISNSATIGFGTISGNTGIDIGLTTGAVTSIDYDIQNSTIIQANQKIPNGNAYATMSLSSNSVFLNNSGTNPLVLKESNTVGGGGFTTPISFPISQRTINTVADASITYNSKINANFVVIVTATVEQAGNGVITMRLRSNGVAITTTVGTSEIKQSVADTLTFSVIGQANIGDIFDIEVESSGGADVLVSEFVLNGYQF